MAAADPLGDLPQLSQNPTPAELAETLGQLGDRLVTLAHLIGELGGLVGALAPIVAALDAIAADARRPPEDVRDERLWQGRRG